MWQRILAEPVALGALIRAIMLALMAFGFDLTADQVGAVMLVTELALALITRAIVTPVVSLPAGVAGQIADRKAAALAEK